MFCLSVRQRIASLCAMPKDAFIESAICCGLVLSLIFKISVFAVVFDNL